MRSPDTQWPRYEVFQQRRAGGSYENVGSVHAPDAEIALQNARDVFVRRPQTVSLWVVPAEAILARTREELEEDGSWQEPDPAPERDEPEIYQVFQKKSQRRSMSYVTRVGEVEALSAAEALRKAWKVFGTEPVYVWWIVPAGAITRSSAADAASMFHPAHEKAFRLPGAYHTRTLMREVQERRKESDQE